MEESPLISIALCTFNGARHLRAQLDSLLAQIDPKFEIVAVDDCSTDETYAILQEYARRDARVQAHRQPQNVGFRRNFEVAMQRCRGELIAPCDQDDVWLPRKLAALRAALGPALMVYCDSLLIDENGRSLGQRISDKFVMFQGGDPAPLVFSNSVSGHAMLFRRALLQRALPFPPLLFHDWWLAFVAASTGDVRYVGEALVQYRQHASSVTDMIGARRQDRNARRGLRMRAIEAVAARLDELACFESPHQQFFRKLERLWRARYHQWLSLRLTLFLLRHRERLFAIERASRMRRTRRALKYWPGLRLKRLVQPEDYAPSS
jgi:glycosyltransferase involved in cell wall biosynthesis